MVAFTEPPWESSRTAEFHHAHQVLADMMSLEAEPSEFFPPIAGWKAWLLVGWMLAVTLWGISLVVGILL
jgi:hypothetical protein